MLSLRFASVGPRPGEPADGTPGVQTWRNRHGGVIARGFREGGQYWMVWPGLCTFSFSQTDSFITAFPEPHALTDIVWDTYRRSVLPMALQAIGFEALHASAVVASSGVVAFCAASETGKSTVAFGLRRRGFPQWADDGIVFRIDGESAVTTPLPFEARLRSPSREIFGGDIPTSTRFQDNGAGEQRHREPAAISAICILTRLSDATANTREPVGTAGSTRIRRLAPAPAFPAVLTHAHVFDPFDTARHKRMLQTYLELLAHVPVYDVEFAAAGDGLDVFLDAIVEGLDLETPARRLSLCRS